jgi:hypothetical protein
VSKDGPDYDEDDDSGQSGFLVMPFDDADDLLDNDDTAELIVVILPDGSEEKTDDSVDEGVAKRRRLAARLSANRIARRPMNGKRLRVAMRARRWRLRNKGKHKLHKATTVSRHQPTLHLTKLKK